MKQAHKATDLKFSPEQMLKELVLETHVAN